MGQCQSMNNVHVPGQVISSGIEGVVTIHPYNKEIAQKHAKLGWKGSTEDERKVILKLFDILDEQFLEQNTLLLPKTSYVNTSRRCLDFQLCNGKTARNHLLSLKSHSEQNEFLEELFVFGLNFLDKLNDNIIFYDDLHFSNIMYCQNTSTGTYSFKVVDWGHCTIYDEWPQNTSFRIRHGLSFFLAGVFKHAKHLNLSILSFAEREYNALQVLSKDGEEPSAGRILDRFDEWKAIHNNNFEGGTGRREKKAKEYGLYNGKQYVIRKDKESRLKYIVCNRAKLFLKDVRGKYKRV